MAFLDLAGISIVIEELFELAEKADPERTKLIKKALDTGDITILKKKDE